jgi:hypothetical protein
MTFTALEWIVLIFAVIGLVKLGVIIVNKKYWMPVIESFYGKKGYDLLFLVLALVIFYFLIQELTIVQILAAVIFATMLIAVSFMQYSDQLLGIAKKMLKKKFSGMMWIYIIIWVVLLIWAVKEILF